MEVLVIFYDLIKSFIAPIFVSIIVSYIVNRRFAHRFYNKAPDPPEIVKCTCRKGSSINSILSPNHRSYDKKYFFEFNVNHDDDNEILSISNGIVHSYDFDEVAKTAITVLIITNNSKRTCILREFIFDNKIRSDVALVGEYKHIRENEVFILCFSSINTAPKHLNFHCGDYVYEPSLIGTDGILSTTPKRMRKDKGHKPLRK
ncbi:hypothetical protein MKA38_08890 [[Clostridium] innocuum]|nr:hypothetical protein [[Clostridium] innocuum]